MPNLQDILPLRAALRRLPPGQGAAAIVGAVRANDVLQLERALEKGVSSSANRVDDAVTSVDTITVLQEGDGDGLLPMRDVHCLNAVSVLILAVVLGHSRIAEALLERGADVGWQRPSNGADAIRVAAQVGNSAMVRMLHKAGADLEGTTTQFEDATTPVVAAAEGGHVETVRVLHELGASVTAPSRDGATPVYVAAEKGHAEVVRMLGYWAGAAEAHDVDGVTPVYIAAQKGHVEVVRALHELGADIAAQAVSGPNPIGAGTYANSVGTPVYTAAKNGHVEMVRVLHELGADVNTPTPGDRYFPLRNSATPVYVAAEKGHAEVVRVLHELGAHVKTPHGADIDTPHKDGATPVHAVTAQSTGLFTDWWCMNDGDDGKVLSLRSFKMAKYGECPSSGVQKRCVQVGRVLHELGASIDTPNKAGVTPLALAYSNQGCGAMAKALILLGASTDIDWKIRRVNPSGARTSETGRPDCSCNIAHSNAHSSSAAARARARARVRANHRSSLFWPSIAAPSLPRSVTRSPNSVAY